tara:strand:- start:285 stop:419 length:135 start_codon:yes stop_codon:yes gene_type:complete
LISYPKLNFHVWDLTGIKGKNDSRSPYIFYGRLGNMIKFEFTKF